MRRNNQTCKSLRALRSRNGRGLITILLLIVLISILAVMLPRATKKMIDYAALAEMKQVAIYSGRAIQSNWGRESPELRKSLSLQEVRELIEGGPLELNPMVAFANESFIPGGYLQLKHERFGDRVFLFDYEGKQVEPN
jgi:hypothetical protein